MCSVAGLSVVPHVAKLMLVFGSCRKMINVFISLQMMSIFLPIGLSENYSKLTLFLLGQIEKKVSECKSAIVIV